MSNKQHLQDLADDVEHLDPKSLDGGACLNRHRGGPPSSDDKNSCFHRWQAYEKMDSEKEYYNYSRYKSLVDAEGGTLNVAAPGMPPYARRSFPNPKKNEWDCGESCSRRFWVDGQPRFKPFKNFYERSSVPYNHQAHHLIANAELSDTIEEVFAPIDSVVPFRRGLVKAKYNLNHADNMMMLPMDKLVADAMRLPLHQSAWWMRSHPAWSNCVVVRLKAIFNPLKKQLQQHKARDYGSVKQQLEDTARELRPQVLDSGAPSLDALAPSIQFT